MSEIISSKEKGIMFDRLPSLSLCEQLNSCNLSRVVDNLRKADHLDRVYIGSSFCCRYLFQAANDVFEDILGECEGLGVEVTLVVPIATERFCSTMIDFLDDFAKRTDTITEITCNDHALLDHCAKSYPQKINVGRLFSKDTREIREPYFTDLTIAPSILERDMDRLFPMDRIASIEIDPTHKFQDVLKAPAEKDVALYMDWCYQTTGMICEQAATHVSLREKFRPSATCTGECQHFAIFYEGQMGYPYYKHGSTVYYRQEDARLIRDGVYRQIFSPLLTEMFLPEDDIDPWSVFRERAA